MILEFQRANGMSYTFDGVRLSVSEVVTRIDAPLRAGARMLRVQDAIENRIAQIDIPRSHIDLGSQHPRAVWKLAGAHAAEKVETLLHWTIAVRAFSARFRQSTPREQQFILGLIVDVGLAGAD